MFVMKKAFAATVGILAFVIAGAAVYGIFSLNETIQSKPNPIQVSNYSAAIGSLQPQINSINNNMSSLSTLKGDITDIRGKLSDLESKISQAQQPSVSVKPAIVSGKPYYFPGDTLNVVAVGFKSQSPVQIQLLDNNGYVVIQDQARSDSAGRITHDMQLPINISPGSFQVKLISGQNIASQSIAIISSGPISVSSSGITYLFTAQTDKSVYQTGEQIEIFGIGIPNTIVTAILTSPSGFTSSASTTVQSYGAYALFFSDSPPFETGTWSITVKDLGLQRTAYFTVQSGNYNPPTFTAQPSRIVYQAGDVISVSGAGFPDTNVLGVLTSPSGIRFSASTTTSSDGSYTLSYFVSNSYEKGNWYITLNNHGQTRQVYIYIGPVSSSGGSFSFTAQTDKTIYTKGSLIRISGTGPPFATVDTALTSPSGKTYNGAATINFDGSYNISYSALPSFETGNWHITLTQGVEVRVISIFLEP